MKSKTIHLYMHEDIKDKLQSLSLEIGVSKSKIIDLIIRNINIKGVYNLISKNGGE